MFPLIVAVLIIAILHSAGLSFGPALFLTATLFFWFGWDWLRARNWS
jgi:hypothetical protein